MINRAQFDEELRAAGVAVLAYSSEGPATGQAILADGTLVRPDGSLGRNHGDGPPDEGAAARYLAVARAHEPREVEPVVVVDPLAVLARAVLDGQALTTSDREALQKIAGRVEK